MFPKTIEISLTLNSGEARAKRIARTSSTPGSVSTINVRGIFDSICEFMRIWAEGAGCRRAGAWPFMKGYIEV